MPLPPSLAELRERLRAMGDADAAESAWLVALLDAGVAELAAAPRTLDAAAALAPAAALGPAAAAPDTSVTFPDVTFSSPRGSFAVDVTPRGIVLRGKTKALAVDRSNVRLLATLPDDRTGNLLLVHLATPVAVAVAAGAGEHQTTRVLVAVPRLKGTAPVAAGSGAPQELLDALAARPPLARDALLERVLEVGLGARSRRPDAGVFRSSKGAFGVPCHVNSVKEGVAWFLREGVAFTQTPTLFVPVDSLSSIGISRSTPRTFDVLVSTTDGASHEFSLIDIAEKPAVCEYMAHLKRVAAGRARRADDGAAERRVADERAPGGSSSAGAGPAPNEATIVTAAAAPAAEDEHEDEDDDDNPDDSDYESDTSSSESNDDRDSGSAASAAAAAAAGDASHDEKSSGSDSDSDSDSGSDSALRGAEMAELVEDDFVPDPDVEVLPDAPAGERRKRARRGGAAASSS